MRKSASCILVALGACTTATQIALAQGLAQGYFLADSVVKPFIADSTHFTVSFVTGWISDNDNWFHNFLSSKNKLTITIDGQFTTFDNVSIPATFVSNVNPVGKNTDVPFGVSITTLDNVPGDVRTAQATLSVMIFTDNNLQKILDVLHTNQGDLPASFAASPIIGFAGVASSLLSSLFGIGGTRTPFSWQGNVKQTPDNHAEQIAPGYLILISGNGHNNDTFFKNLDKSKLHFDGTQVLVGTTKLIDHSWAVLSIHKGEGYKIPELRHGSSSPWAILARSLQANSLTHKGTAAELQTLADNTVAQLSDGETLLLAEQRFTSFDRAVALATFAYEAIDALDKQCTSANVTPCPVTGIQQFEDNIATDFNLPADWKPNIAKKAQTIAAADKFRYAP